MIKLVVFDWAGTLVDHGSRAPALAFVETFAQFGVEASEAEARAPMGMPKRPHIQQMLAAAPMAARWEEAHGPVTDETIDQLYEAFEPIAAEVAAREAAPIRGVALALQHLWAKNIRVGSTTGYARSILQGVLPVAAAAGVAPDCVICADEITGGRPAPDGVLANMAHFGVTDPAEVLKVDDAAPGVLEGVNAGARSIGITLSGNGVGLSETALSALTDAETARARDTAAIALIQAGAIATLDSVASLPAWIEANA